MPKGFIMMTALPPTKGHLSLIEFAVAYSRSYGLSDIHIMVCSQPSEPYRDRVWDLASAFTPYMFIHDIHFHDFHKEMPQNPEDHPDFWGLWQSQIYATVGPFADDDIVFSSEPYGYPLAKVLGCKHVPYDLNRDVTWAKASQVRADPYKYWYSLIEPTQRRYQKTITIFGAESTGKTTLSKHLANEFNSRFLPEWARPYLESLGVEETCPKCAGSGAIVYPSTNFDTLPVGSYIPSFTESCPQCRGRGKVTINVETTDERMEVIVHGQRALEQSAKKLPSTPFIFRDTDLLSTVGYYGIYSEHTPPIAVDKADLYLLCESNIPFTPDPLRYGGDKRESTDQYWEDLLRQYQCKSVRVNMPIGGGRLLQARTAVDTFFRVKTDWMGYVRK